jgi:hypothetical protein
MKKKLLATGVALALSSLAGSAYAQLAVNHGGVGQINVIPYYSVQEGNNTLISITNTDTVNGKVVKVRFRGAEWSDDVFDFQLFLSPGDVWTAAVTKNGNVAHLATSDTSCTLPADVNRDFVTTRLDPARRNVGTLEGYVEIITMGNIHPKLYNATSGDDAAGKGNALYKAIKHAAGGQPPCRTVAEAQTLLEGLKEDNAGVWLKGGLNFANSSPLVSTIGYGPAYTATGAVNGVGQPGNYVGTYSADASSIFYGLPKQFGGDARPRSTTGSPTPRPA